MLNPPRKKNIVLLTATITPKSDQPNLSIVDPVTRLNEYCEALQFYSELLDANVIDGLVFGENSGFDLRMLARKFPSPRIEWLGYYDLDYPAGFHRGYGEFRLIDKCFLDSNQIQELDQYDAVWKISGRYILKNIESMIKYSRQNFDLYCDVRNGWAEMSVLAWSVLGYQRIIRGLCEKFSSGMAPELILAGIIENHRHDDLKYILKYSWPPSLIGRRGSDGSSYRGRLFGLKFAVSVVRSIVINIGRMLTSFAQKN